MTDTRCPDCDRIHGSERPNIAHYHRASRRHAWRTGSTTVNASPCSLPTLRRVPGDPNLYADVPYDWGLWQPPRSTRRLPGITPAMVAAMGD
jgi:hypothetical protein